METTQRLPAPGNRLARVSREALAVPVVALGLTRRAREALGDFETVAELLGAAEADLLRRRNFGRASLAEVRRRLARFAMDALGIPEEDPMRALCAAAHRMAAIWVAPARARSLASFLEEVLELLARGAVPAMAETSHGTRRRAANGAAGSDLRHATLPDVADRVFAELKPREREIVQLRFSAPDAEAPSLADLGRRFGVSRERARQLLAASLERLREEDARQRRRPLTDYLTRVFASAGGVLREDAVVGALRTRFLGDGRHARPLARVLLETTPQFRCVRPGIWCLARAGYPPPDHVAATLDSLHAALRKSRRLMTLRQLAVAARLPRPAHCSLETYLGACVAADPRLREFSGGRIGLAMWAWGVPQTLEECLVACLRAEGRPQRAARLAEAVRELLPPGTAVDIREVRATLGSSAAFRRVRPGVYELASDGRQGAREDRTDASEARWAPPEGGPDAERNARSTG